MAEASRLQSYDLNVCTIHGERSWHFPSKRREKTSWHWQRQRHVGQEAEHDRRAGRKQRLRSGSFLCSLQGASSHLAAGDEATASECGSLSLDSTVLSLLEPLFGARAFEYCMLYPGLRSTARFPRALYCAHRWGCVHCNAYLFIGQEMSVSHQNKNWHLHIDCIYMHAVTSPLSYRILIQVTQHTRISPAVHQLQLLAKQNGNNYHFISYSWNKL